VSFAVLDSSVGQDTILSGSLRILTAGHKQSKVILYDASPLVALINKADSRHQNCVDALHTIQGN